MDVLKGACPLAKKHSFSQRESEIQQTLYLRLLSQQVSPILYASKSICALIDCQGGPTTRCFCHDALRCAEG